MDDQHKEQGTEYMTYPEVQKFLDRSVLQVMDEMEISSYDRQAFHLSCFTNEWVTKDMARAVCRSLTDRGFAFYANGLFNEDGMTAGAGYGITEKGRAYLGEIISTQKEEDHE